MESKVAEGRRVGVGLIKLYISNLCVLRHLLSLWSTCSYYYEIFLLGSLSFRVLDKRGGVIESAQTTGELSERGAETFRRAEKTLRT